ncbi:MAG: rhodanese-related sulfurtransferase [Desulforhopalus sp.]
MSVSDLRSMDKEHPNTHLVDVLPPDHFENVHIPGAKNACVFFVSFLDDLATIISDIKERVVVYGSSERSHDTKMAIEKMTRAGYLEVYELKGGIKPGVRLGMLVKVMPLISQMIHKLICHSLMVLLSLIMILALLNGKDATTKSSDYLSSSTISTMSPPLSSGSRLK